MSRFGALLVVAGLVLMAGCHSSTGASGPFAGHWTGQDLSGQVDLDLQLKDGSDGVSGSGTLSGSAISGGSVGVTVNGSESGGTCSLTLSAPPYTHATLSGSESNGTWTAVLNGSGFSDVGVTLQKQAH